METYFEVGQTVYCSIFGKGIVVETDGLKANEYPIGVKFKEKQNVKFYTSDGRYYEKSIVCLSQNPIPPIINTPLIKFKEGELVFGYIGDCWMLCYYYQPVGTLLSVYKQNTQEKLLYATEVRKITDIPLPLKM